MSSMPTLGRALSGRPAGPAVARHGDGARPPAPQSAAHPRRHALGLLAAVALGVAVTVLVTTIPSLRYGPQRPVLHAQIATAAALVALLVALLAAGRYRRDALVADVLLALSFGVLGVSNLVTSAIQGATGESPRGALAWMPVSGRLVAAALLAVAALSATRAVRRTQHTARLLAFASAAAVALLALGLAALDPQLPPAIAVGAAANGVPFGPFAGSAASIALKGACLALVAVAAIGFAARARRTPDGLSVPLSWGTALLAFAWLNSLLVPSLYVNWFYAGDVLGLVAYALLAGGAVAEIRAVQRDRARLAA
ncbi:MAG TPA: hypothetical protein VN635_16155, partial [Conexibacter sp.]|nr:hypothetical protein [Conexibacter sp.]